jgi:hypothetical protein
VYVIAEPSNDESTASGAGAASARGERLMASTIAALTSVGGARY